MGLNDLAKADWQRITTNKDRGFGVDITFKTPDLLTTLAVVGLGTNHSLSIDNDGNPVQSKNAHVTISEALFSDASYPVRDTLTDQVDLMGHLVSYPDSTGVMKDYIVIQQFPDETVGVITCILSDFEQEGYDPLADDDLVMYYDFSGLIINTDNPFGTVDNSGLVSNWKNLKGTSSYDLTQSTTTEKPILNADFIEFDNVNDFLASSDLPVELKNLNDFTFVVVGESLPISNRVTFQGSDNNFISHLLRSTNETQMNSSDGGSTLALRENTAITTGDTFINFCNFKPDWTIISNGNSNLSGSLVNTNSPDISKLEVSRITLTSPVFVLTKIKSIMVWKNEVTDAQKLIDLNTFLNDKWL